MRKIVLFFICIIPSILFSEDKLSSFYLNGDYESIVKQLEDVTADDLSLYELNLLGNAYNRLGDKSLSKLYYFLASLSYPHSGEIKNNIKIVAGSDKKLNSTFLEFGMSKRELVTLVNTCLILLTIFIFFYARLVKSRLYLFSIFVLFLLSAYISFSTPKLASFKVLNAASELKSGFDPKAFSFTKLEAGEIIQVNERVGKYFRVTTVEGINKTGWVSKEEVSP